MRKICLLAMVCLLTIAGKSQQPAITGVVRDTTENRNLQHAVVSLLRSSDSVLINFTRTNADGVFTFSQIAAGNYVLLITYPKFADYADIISVKEQETLTLGKLALTPASVVMKEVIVRANNTMRIRGDTTEFTADSFKVRPGATVEELLQQIPGMTVNSKGEITAQGKRVDKVLVDGEEFFGDDPTIATRNLGAKAVDKVQIFDTKSEQDQLKSIGAASDAGKTINIKLKEDAKKGYFGKIDAGSNAKNIHNGQFMLNKFKGPQKISLYGTKSTTSTGSLGWEDREKLGIEEGDMEYDEINDFYYSYGGGDEFSSYNLQGLPNAYTVGALYNDRFKEDKHKMNLSYLYNRLATTNRTSSISQSLLRDSMFFNNSTGISKGMSQRHSISGRYDWKIDSLASIRFTMKGMQSEKSQFTETYSNAQDENRELVNENERENNNLSKKRDLTSSLMYTQMFKKKNRKLITTLRFGLVEDDGDQLLQSTTRFYSGGVVDSVDQIDQRKLFDGKSRTIGAKVTFNEPVTDKINIVTEYSLNNNNAQSYQQSYDADLDGKYNIYNPSFSNNFDMIATSNSGTVTGRYMGKKWRMTAGAGLSSIALRLKNLDANSKNNYDFLGFTPQVGVAYSASQQKNVGFSYRGSTVQPTLNQLQPVRNNTNPLNEYIGNPDLKVGFNHNFSLNFRDYKVLSGKSFFVNLGVNFIDNAITQSSTIEKGKVTYQPINVDGNYNYYMWSSISLGRGQKKLNHSFQLGSNGGKNMNIVNSERNSNSYSSFNLNYSIEYYDSEKWNFHFGPNIAYNMSKSSLRPDANNNYWQFGGRSNLWVKLPGRFEFYTDLESSIRQKTETFPDAISINVWNARLTKNFMKEDALKLSLYAYDILNQNIGLNRNINSNFMSENRFDRVSQYFMLSATWTFNKMPGAGK